MPEGLAATLAGGAFALAMLAFLLVLFLALRVRRLGKRLGKAGSSGAGDGLPSADRERLDSLGRELTGLGEQLRRVENEGRRAVARVGVVRFNPFEDTGGNQSFALALLDARNDGVVISSLHSRQQTRVYLKSIAGGRAEAALSDEESEALRRATGDSRPAV